MDVELQAMQTTLETLKKLPQDAQHRVLEWVEDRLKRDAANQEKMAALELDRA